VGARKLALIKVKPHKGEWYGKEADSSSTSRTSSAGRKESSSITPVATSFLSPLLPRGWQAFFNARRVGKYWGLSIVCPFCEEAPPAKLLGARRWRWLSVHIAKHNKGGDRK
jgi:hypothetical protein